FHVTGVQTCALPIFQYSTSNSLDIPNRFLLFSLILASMLLSEYHMHRKIILFTAIAVILAACGIDRQAKELRALEKCRYEFVSADSLFLAGTDINKLIAGGQIDVGRLPGVALGFLNRDVPLSGLLIIQVTTPTNILVGIRQFAYLIEIEGTEVVNGTSDPPSPYHREKLLLC